MSNRGKVEFIPSHHFVISPLNGIISEHGICVCFGIYKLKILFQPESGISVVSLISHQSHAYHAGTRHYYKLIWHWNGDEMVIYIYIDL